MKIVQIKLTDELNEKIEKLQELMKPKPGKYDLINWLLETATDSKLEEIAKNEH